MNFHRSKQSRIATLARRLPALLVLSFISTSGLEAQEPAGSKLLAIQRRQVTLTPAESYRVPLRLEPIRSVTIIAPYDCVVKSIAEKEGRAVNAEVEVLRLDNQRLDLLTKRATAAREVAQSEVRIARSSNNAEQIKLAEAKLVVAESDWSLAVFDLAAASIRAPYAATLLRVHVAEGQQLKAGQPLVTFGDVSKLKCRLPVDRDVVKVGATLELAVEAQTVRAIVESVTVLDAEHDKQRELAVSAATAVAVIESASGGWHPGQVVYGPLSPRGSVLSVPLTSVKTDASGSRIVQVLREGVIRNVPVMLHGQIGKEALFVSGQLSEKDELVLSTSQELADGTSVKPASGNVAAANKAGGPNAAAPGVTAPAAKKTSGAGL